MVKPKKRLGQHFLKDVHIAQRIIEAFAPVQEDFIIEIGFGTGVLTQYILDKDALFLDVDKESFAFMTKKYPQYKHKFKLADFLQLPLQEYGKNIALIGNLPYNISSQIFFKILDNKDIIKHSVFMVQKEVAQRLVSSGNNKEYGILSVLLGVYYDIKLLFDVKPGAFNPPPKVVSSVISMNRNNVKNIGVPDTFFKQVVKSAFSQRRKMLRNTLSPFLKGEKISQNISAYLNKRPEQLSPRDFILLATELFSITKL